MLWPRVALIAPFKFAIPPSLQIFRSLTISEPVITREHTMKLFRLGKLAVMGLAVCLLAAPQAKAGIGFQPVSPDELKMTSEPLAPGAPAIILYRQVDRDDNTHTGHEDNYVRVKILTEEGRRHANVEIPFNKGTDDVANVRARTIEPDGSIVNFEGKVFEKELAKGRGFKRLAKTFTLPDVRVGSIIEYYFTWDLKEHYVFDSHWILSEDLFTKRATFSLRPYMGNGYNQFSIRWTWQNLPPGAAPKQGPDNIIRMEAANIPAFEMEDHMPPPNELKSRVDFIYEDALPPKDQVAFWKNFGKKRNGEVESFINKHKAMEDAVRQTVSPDDTQEVKLRKIYDRVQQIRNTSYEPLKTEQEIKREKPAENVEDIWRRGYGNGYQLTWLFLALARAAGFEAYGCLVSGRADYFFSPQMMQSHKLNSNVVLVKLNGKELYFDPGNRFSPFGLPQWSETGVIGMRLDKDGGTWIQTTLPEAFESRIERIGKFKLTETGDLEGKLTVTSIGLDAMYQRMEERFADQVERKKFLEEQVTSQSGGATEAELINQPDWSNSETPLIAEFDLKIPGWASSAGKRVMIPAAIFTTAERGIFEHTNRTHPIYFEYPHQKLDDLTVELPAGWQVTSVPSPLERDAKSALYSLKVEQNQGSLRLTRKLSIDFLLLQQKYYPALRNFFQTVRTGDGSQVMLQPGEIHATSQVTN
jgi:hypothetical protein